MSDHTIVTKTPLWRNLGPKHLTFPVTVWPSVSAAWQGLGVSRCRADLFINGELRPWSDYEWLAE